ncbi:MAG: ABC transporter substrate-binding protein [Candidatus Poribacteria bacterium]|nr:ABC transporter substrate-binding protein [Candidatus Poribacteria bacterium]
MPGTAKTLRWNLIIALCAIVWSTLAGCDPANPNNPYRAEESDQQIYYSTFDEPPKHLDPAKSYSADEFAFISTIYEPPIEYHYLKRPYELIPLTVETIPTALYYDEAGNELSDEAPAEQVHRVVYNVRIKQGIMYQDHPAFVTNADGSPTYANLTDADVAEIGEIKDFERVASRELKAKDYVYQIYRLADPRVQCPVYSIFENYIVGMSEFQGAVKGELERVRAERKAQRGAYDVARDEREDPIRIDYATFPFEGVEVVDDYTYRITLTRKYPQFLYWLAMPFFSPMPEEAIAFYDQGALIRKNIVLDQFPVGTGPYRIETYNPILEIVLTKNENYHDAFYPTEGEDEDEAKRYLEPAGRKLPFIEKLVYKLEKESLPRWNKFLQGYYDASGIAEESFDQAISVGEKTGPELSDYMVERGIDLSTSVEMTTSYFAFNMDDALVGGYTPEKRKLRQAISIALDMEEFIQIFLNGRGEPGHGPLPPDIFGARDGRARMNEFVYDWNEATQQPVRKSLDEAKRLLAEAGYPNGRDKDGNPLIITFDNAWTNAGARTRIRWIEKRLELIGVTLKNDTTDYSRFQDKVYNGNFQLIFWGWIADYPDPENFMFLLYGPNSRSNNDGPNSANYNSPAFNELFTQMENMTNSPERLELMNRMTRIVQEDAPWVFAYHPVSYSLKHEWVNYAKPSVLFGLNVMKYRAVDPELRASRRGDWNQPNYLVAFGLVGLVVIGTIPAIRASRRRERSA